MPHELSFGEFVRQVGLFMRLDIPEAATERTDLYDELTLDSFQAFELIIVTESLAENLAPPSGIPELYTLGDAFGYYLALRAGQPRPSA